MNQAASKQSLPELLKQAIALHQQGRLDVAEPIYQEILQLQPEHFDALHLLGVIALQKGQLQDSINLIKRAIAVDSSQSAAYSNLGNALMSLQQPEEALASYERAIALKPDYAEALNNRGMALRALQRQEEAQLDFEMALQFKPDYLEALQNQADTLHDIKRVDEALESYKAMLVLAPDNVFALNCIGCILGNMGKHEEALPCFERALELSPNYASVMGNLGGALLQLRRAEEAASIFERLLTLIPHSKQTLGSMLWARQFNCDWTDYVETSERIVNAIGQLEPATTPFPFLSVSASATLQLNCARMYTAQQPDYTPLWQSERYQHKKIRIAYVSADFRDHPLSYLMAGLLEKHDRQRFEIIGIDLRAETQSEIRPRLLAAFDHFIEGSDKTDLEIAGLMRELEIDIAVDLMGHTQHCRTGIFALRPAPVQINYLGFPGSMGAEFIDYIIADEFVIPRQNQLHYAEQVVYLPDCFQANDDQRKIATKPLTRKMVGLPASGFVFCSFNNSYKQNPACFDIWMRLLGKVEESVLWVLADTPAVYHNLRRQAANRGIDPERLIFAPRLSYATHLARLGLADLFLDTLPFNAGTTASDALWAGLPVLTCTGEAFAARMAGSLLQAIGLAALITHNAEDYEALALELATSPEKLAVIKINLKKNRNTYPLFDTDRFRRHIEAAYSTMWQRSQQGLAAETFSVQPIE